MSKGLWLSASFRKLYGTLNCVLKQELANFLQDFCSIFGLVFCCNFVCLDLFYSAFYEQFECLHWMPFPHFLKYLPLYDVLNLPWQAPSAILCWWIL